VTAVRVCELANLTHSQDQVQIHWLQYHLS